MSFRSMKKEMHKEKIKKRKEGTQYSVFIYISMVAMFGLCRSHRLFLCI